MSYKFWNKWFNKNLVAKNNEDSLLKQHEAVIIEATSLENQYKLMTIRGVMVTYTNGDFSSDMYLPENLRLDMCRRMSRVGLLVEGPWYSYEDIFDSTLDFINIDYRDMEELYIPDIINSFKRAMDHARINGHMEVVIYGSPVLINVLLPYIDILEIFTNKLEPLKPTNNSSFARLITVNAEVASDFTIGVAEFTTTKRFETPSYKYFNLVNVKPLEIKQND